MKKNFYIISFFCICFLVNFNYVKARTYSCTYDFTVDMDKLGWITQDRSLEFTINTITNTITYSDGFLSQNFVTFLDYYIDSRFTTSYIIESLDGGCVEKVVIGIGQNRNNYYIIFEESNLYRLTKGNEFLTGIKYGLPERFREETNNLDNIYDIIIGEYDANKSTGKLVESNNGCIYYDEMFDVLESLKCNDYKKNCNSSEKKEYNTKKDNLKSFCKNVLQTASTGISRCIMPCISLYDAINGIEVGYSQVDCGISEKLAIWIGNIIRWVKYIIPSVVIIFGILDFIKALGVDKEDEMKKAQKKFIRRLIAAALIFIAPFIIEFILDKMGFSSNGCGIIDL